MIDHKELRRLAEAAKQAHDLYKSEPDGFTAIDSLHAQTELDRVVSPPVVLALLDEVESLRKDAERYRWLRDAPIADDAQEWICAGMFDMGGVSELDGEELDSAIDAAMQAKEAE